MYIRALFLDYCSSEGQLIRLLWLFRDYVFASEMWQQIKRHIMIALLPHHTETALHAEIMKSALVTIMYGLIYKDEYIEYPFTQYSIDAAKQTLSNNVTFWFERAHANLQFWRRHSLAVPSSFSLLRLAQVCNREKLNSLLQHKKDYITSFNVARRNKALRLAHQSNNSRLGLFPVDFLNWFIQTYESHMHPSLIFAALQDTDLTNFYAQDLTRFV